jgi:hypothetical protein
MLLFVEIAFSILVKSSTTSLPGMQPVATQPGGSVEEAKALDFRRKKTPPDELLNTRY